LWELVTKCVTGKYALPYSEYPHINFDFQIIIQVAKKGIRPTIPTQVPIEVALLIRKLWEDKPQNRPNTEKILEDIDLLVTTYEANKSHWDSPRGTTSLTTSCLPTSSQSFPVLITSTVNQSLNNNITFSLPTLNVPELSNFNEKTQKTERIRVRDRTRRKSAQITHVEKRKRRRSENQRKSQTLSPSPRGKDKEKVKSAGNSPRSTPRRSKTDFN